MGLCGFVASEGGYKDSLICNFSMCQNDDPTALVGTAMQEQRSGLHGSCPIFHLAELNGVLGTLQPYTVVCVFPQHPLKTQWLVCWPVTSHTDRSKRD